MPKKKENTSKRKKEHIEICLKKDVSFRNKTNGLDKYEFEHYAITDVDIEKIDFSTKFLGKTISFPFLISCMTGGTYESAEINSQLAAAAKKLNIPIGSGSQRQAIESKEQIQSFKVLRKESGNVPLLANIGAGQVVLAKDPVSLSKELIEMIEANALVIHVNPLQELFQKSGNTNFEGLLPAIEKICRSVKTPLIIKEVGSGISGKAAKKLLKAGVKGIDVAGAGGTSWSAVEMIRNNNSDDYFRDWGLPTSYCIKESAKLKKDFNFSLIASGGINSGRDIAKSIALGADLAASANPLLKAVVSGGIDGVVNLVSSWFEDVRKIMYLTGSKDLASLSKVKLIKSRDIY
jgi:isopentenyl-diphosphate delta-isomerase